MANKNFIVKNGLTVGSTERISSAGVITGTTATQSVGNSSTLLATTAYVRGEIDALIDSAPGTLNTLDELAAAINDDAQFNTTLTDAVALKAPLASPTFTGTITGAGPWSLTHGSTPYLDLKVGSTMKGRFYADANQAIIEAVGNSLILKSASTTALTFDSSQNATFAGNINTPGNLTIDSAGSAGIVLDRASTSTGSTVDFKTAGTLKWYMGLRGLTNDNFYLRDEVGSTDALTITSGGNLTVAGTLGVASTIRVTTDGSASAPCYQVGGDADTGMYQPTTNQLGFTVAGTQKAYFTTVAFNLDSSLTSGFGLGDNVPIKLGNSGDMEIYHDGSDNLIKSGDLRIWTPSFKVKSGDGSENMIVADENDSVELRYNGSKKIETTNTGIEVTGDINFTGTLREDGTEFSGGISTGKAIAMAIVFG